MKKLIPILLLFSSCKKNDASQVNIPCDPLISYNNEVKAIFVTNCANSGCHDGVNFPSLANYTITHDASQQIRAAVARGSMPLNKRLSATDKAAILCWIDSGSQNN